MKRTSVDLRVFIATVVLLVAALALLGTAFVTVYNAPEQHLVSFQGDITATVVNYSTIVHRQNLTESGIPNGARLALNWVFAGPGGQIALLAYVGSSPDGRNAVVCETGPTTIYSGACAWMAVDGTFTILISASVGEAPLTGANFTAEVSVQGYYTYTTTPY